MRSLRLLALAFILSTSIASAGSISTSVLIAAGGQASAVAGAYRFGVSIGQPIVGRASSSAYQLCYGYWCNSLTYPGGPSGHRIYLPLVAHNYDPNQDRYEPDDTAQQAKPISTDGTLQSHNFYPAGDVDWVQLAVSPGTYVIQTSVLSNTYPDTVMALYASNGTTQLAFNDDCTPYTRASCLTYPSSISTTLYLKVWPYDTTSIGPDSWYSLSVVRQ